MSAVSPSLLKTKQHFSVLDGLRGVAALAVLLFHFTEMAIYDYSKNFIGHGFLAVDFFFCLSGFVIGYAYDDRIAKMGTWEFFKSRIIRLHPLIALGSVLGLISFLIDPFSTYKYVYGAGKLALFFLTSFFLIPYPMMEERSFNLFSFNAPTWSLFWEYIANIFYALIIYKLGKRFLLILTILAAVLVYYVCSQAGNLMGGWGGPNFWEGGARILYSFLAGLLVYRSNWIIKNRIGFFGLAILLSLAFLMPYSDWNWITEPFVVLIYFPFLVALGAGATAKGGTEKFCNFAGDLSYPLYMTHYVVIWMFLNYYTIHKPDTMQLALIVGFGTIVLIGFAYLIMIWYDIPVRAWLKKKRTA